MKILLPAFMLLVIGCKDTEKNALNLPLAKDAAGIGLLHLSPNKNYKFYKDFQAAEAYDSLQISEVKDGRDKGKASYSTEHLGKSLQPYDLYSGDSDSEGEANRNMGLIRFNPTITFTVAERQGEFYKVVINEKTRETSVIRLDAKHDFRKTTADKDNLFFDPNFMVQTKDPYWYFYETWPQALQRAFVIGFTDKVPLYDAPNGNLVRHTFDVGRADSVYGDWARITNDVYNDKSEPDNKVWLRWKDSTGIKVSITLNGGYE